VKPRADDSQRSKPDASSPEDAGIPVTDDEATARAERAAEADEQAEAATVSEESRIGGTPAPGTEAAALAEARDRWLRAEAEMQNVRRRAVREREELRREIEDQGLLELANLQEDLERALATAREAGAPETWTRGVELVQARIGELMARQGATPIDPMGERFDPNLHEALLEVDAPAGVEPGVVVQVIARGLARAGRAVRAARVVVARTPETGGAS
jgi:molecular chaperone GrpE